MAFPRSFHYISQQTWGCQGPRWEWKLDDPQLQVVKDLLTSIGVSLIRSIGLWLVGGNRPTHQRPKKIHDDLWWFMDHINIPIMGLSWFFKFPEVSEGSMISPQGENTWNHQRNSSGPDKSGLTLPASEESQLFLVQRNTPVVAHPGDLVGFAHPLTNVEYLHRLFIYIGIYIYISI